MTHLARHATVPQLRRACARHAFDVRPPEAQEGHEPEAPEPVSASEGRACARPELAMRYDADGRFQLAYSAPATIGALVEQALKEAKDALFTSADTTLDRDRDRPTYADALAELANRSLASVDSPARSSHYRVYLHLSTDGAWVGGGHAIPLRLLGRFVSDGVAQPVWETDGRPVSVGRAMRILPARARRLVEDRDRGCRFPGCVTTRFVEVHHLTPWADGGTTGIDNSVSLCPQHHDALDRGDYTLTGDPNRPDGLVARNRYGLQVRPPSPVETAAPPGGDPPVPRDTYQPPTGEPVRWQDLELPPDAELTGPPPLLACVTQLSVARGPASTPKTPWAAELGS
jgi:hypothetical protein